MGDFAITYQKGLEHQGRTICTEIDRLEEERDGLRFWRIFAKRKNARALKAAHEEHLCTIDVDVTWPAALDYLTGQSDDHGQVRLRLSEQPDGLGFYYGDARLGDEVVRVNVLPPASQWRGQHKLDDHPPDPTRWKVFADGELIARVERRDDAPTALLPFLTKGTEPTV